MSSPPPVIHMPAEIVEATRQILALWSQIEDFELKAELHGHHPGDRPRVGQNLHALALRTRPNGTCSQRADHSWPASASVLNSWRKCRPWPRSTTYSDRAKP